MGSKAMRERHKSVIILADSMHKRQTLSIDIPVLVAVLSLFPFILPLNLSKDHRIPIT
jgi:hypothetical protein